jgi:pimeloyl-ACP methyl ester carboxylesterase
MMDPRHQIVPSVLSVRSQSKRERLILWLTRQPGPDDRGVYAHLATGSATRAIVFIHGLAGDALQSWTRFPDMLTAVPDAADCDLIFYDYDSLSQQLGNMVTPFMRFLRELATEPAEMLNRGLSLPRHRPKTFRYEGILIVAHSLGAVVARRALLDAQGNRESWVGRTRFMLFAPADCGADKITLVSESLQSLPLGTVLGGAAKWTIPVLSSLEPGRGDLQRLVDDTRQLTARGMAAHLLAKRVLWASDESVTKKQKFMVEESYDEIPGTTHTSVCKPSPSKMDAVKELLGALREVP